MKFRLSVIVEGQGDAEAVPILLRRLAPQIDRNLTFEIGRPIRINKTRLLRKDELERTVEFAARKLEGNGGILILVDSDEDCPAERGPQLLARARQARPDTRIRTVLAKKEFEAWILAAAKSLRGQRGLPDDLNPPEGPEEIRGAKEWLSNQMRNKSYSATSDQPAFATMMDLDEARDAPSFAYFVEKLIELVSQKVGDSQES